MVHEKIKDLRDTLVETKTENQSTHEIVKDIRDYLVGEKDELETTNEIVRDIRDELADTQVGITTAEMVKEIHDQIDDPAEAPQTIEEMLSDFQTSLSETETVSGNIVRFDNARALPFKKLNVNFQPIQDGTPWIQDAESEPYIQRAVSVERAGNHISDSVVGGTLAWNQLVKDVGETDTTSGAIASFSDGADGVPMQSVVVSMTPQQDLHGQDAPYPAGGGVNKFGDYTIANGYITSSGSITAQADNRTYIVPIDSNTGYAIKIQRTNASGSTDNDDVQISEFYDDLRPVVGSTGGTRLKAGGYANNIYSTTFTTGATAKWLAIKIGNVTKTNVEETVLTVQLEKGSSVSPNWSPYSNICPISGWDEGTVWGTGKNLLNPIPYNGIIYNPAVGTTITLTELSDVTKSGDTFTRTVSGWQGFGMISSKLKTGSYYLTAELTSANMRSSIFVLNADMTVSRNIGNQSGGTTRSITKDITLSGDEAYIAFNCISSAEGTVTISAPQIELGSVATAYEPYTGASYHSDFPATVYGGTLDVVSGVLTIDRYFVDPTQWTRYNANNGYIAYRNAGLPYGKYGVDRNNEPLSNIVSEFGSFSSGAMDRNIIQTPRPNSDSAYLALREDIDPTTVQLCYLIATPLTYHLTPQEVRTLLGDNNVWSDAGDTNITYLKGTDTLTLNSGRKYLTRINDTDSMVSGSDQSLTVSRGVDNVFDLTQMFGTAVGDHFYNQGVSYFRKYFGKDYYEYNPGELKSVEGLAAHETVGFNQWDEEWELGGLNAQTGLPVASTTMIRSVNFCPCIPNTVYAKTHNPTNLINIFWYDANKNFISVSGGGGNNLYTEVTSPDNARWFRMRTDSAYGAAYKNDICINISDPAKNGTYEPYVKHTYPLGNVTLRGIPKLNGNKWYYDGDTYKGNGSVTRKYGIVDLGTLTWVYSTVGSISVFRQASLNNIQNTGANGLMSNGYSVQSRAANSLQDKDVALASTWWSSIKNIVIRDDDHTDPAEFKAAMSGVMLLYELAEPTTESAAKYTSVQIPGAVERYVADSIVPVGHETRQMDIFPISGRNSGTVWGTGKNLFDGSKLLLANGWTENNGVYSGANSALHRVFSNGFPGINFKADTIYTVSLKFSSTTTSKLTVVGFKYTDGTQSVIYIQGTDDYTVSHTSTTGKSVSYLFFSYGSGDTVYISQMQVEEGSTATDYEPYQGRTISVDWESEAGTVYGGTWDAVSGTLTVTHTYQVLDGTEPWAAYSSTYRFACYENNGFPRKATGQNNVICTHLSVGGYNSNYYVVLMASAAAQFADTAALKTYLAEQYANGTPAYICYELATPLALSVSPQKISAYLGSNTIWSDGDQVEVEYRSKPNRENQENS